MPIALAGQKRNEQRRTGGRRATLFDRIGE